MSTIPIGQNANGTQVELRFDKSNRHGLITGATGTGKTVSLQLLMEGFSRAGVPVFAADVKGDLSGIAAFGSLLGKAADRGRKMTGDFIADRFPVTFWDLFGEHGHPIKTSLQGIGPELTSQMLRLNETQAGAIAIAFKKAVDEQAWMLTLDDLRWTLNEMIEERADTCERYGNVTASSINTAQRQLIALESQGGDKLFGEPPFSVLDLIRLDETGRGFINLLHADQLMEAPKLYATFLLWLLTELFRHLPEVGDIDKPKLVFFFDEAHLLFSDAPKQLLERIERLVRLVRSKGVGVYFVTQSPKDVPDVVLSQLGNRIQHALRAYTPKDQRMVKAAAQAFRPNKGVDVKSIITEMGVGEALVSCMDDAGIPLPVERVQIFPPSAHIGPISVDERRSIIETSCFAHSRAETSVHVQGHQYMRRMKIAAGIDVGLDVGPSDYTPGDLADKHAVSYAQLSALNGLDDAVPVANRLTAKHFLYGWIVCSVLIIATRYVV
ncbi:MAG: helicase HerA-like domain-containing protein [Ahrensia sp.]|nr:helicase HerA-like domain-containing protein [Ahrensia sp.]